MGDLQTIIKNFRNRPQFARLYVNDTLSPIEINYQFEEIEISNLTEFHKYVRIPMERGSENNLGPEYRNWKSSASEDRERWQSLSDEESEWLQVYRMWDPIFFLSRLKGLENRYLLDGNQVYTINGSYSIPSSDFPPLVKMFFEKHSEISRHFMIHLMNHTILAIIQKDFPPFQDILRVEFMFPTLRFDYKIGYF